MSDLFGFGKEMGRSEDYASTCVEGKNTFRYLGVCLNMVRLSKFDWKEAEEKMGKNAYLERLAEFIQR